MKKSVSTSSILRCVRLSLSRMFIQIGCVRVFIEMNVFSSILNISLFRYLNMNYIQMNIDVFQSVYLLIFLRMQTILESLKTYLGKEGGRMCVFFLRVPNGVPYFYRREKVKYKSGLTQMRTSTQARDTLHQRRQGSLSHKLIQTTNTKSGLSPLFDLIQGYVYQVPSRSLLVLPIEDPSIPLLLDQPSDANDEGVEASPHLARELCSLAMPPVLECTRVAGDVDVDLKPVPTPMPNLSSEDALAKNVVHVVLLLKAEVTRQGLVLKPVPCTTIRGPQSVLGCQPCKDLAFKGCPAPLDALVCGRSLEAHTQPSVD